LGREGQLAEAVGTIGTSRQGIWERQRGVLEMQEYRKAGLETIKSSELMYHLIQAAAQNAYQSPTGGKKVLRNDVFLTCHDAEGTRHSSDKLPDAAHSVL
jgi:hypothetical protein